MMLLAACRRHRCFQASASVYGKIGVLDKIVDKIG